MELSIKERLILANQFKILEKLYPDEAKTYANRRKAVEQGYQLDYDQMINGYDEVMTEAECEEVKAILNMYRAIGDGFEKLADKSGIDASRTRFPGFDGNNEGKQHSYVITWLKTLVSTLSSAKEWNIHH